MKQTLKYLGIAAFLSSSFYSCTPPYKTEEVSGTVKSVMDNSVTRLYESLTPAEMDTLSQEYFLQFLSAEEVEVLATKYWYFEVDKPVTVSLMRHVDQKVVPFWLEKSGFKKTDMLVKNDTFTYEVWQKDFPAGKVELGINGFDKHRPVYFISVGAQEYGGDVAISNVFPEGQHFEVMGEGAFTYHDWDGLKLTEVPEDLKGQKLLTTIRGRAREAHMIGAFRDTPHVSSEKPDQLLLSWSGDQKTTMDILWRTSKNVENSTVKYWIKGTNDTLSQAATSFQIEDRLLRNDRYVQRFTGQLKGLTPGTNYEYLVGNSENGWSELGSFKTESEKKDGFSYIWFGDTHYSPVFGNMAQKTLPRHPEISFYQVAGDLVTTGLYRDDWDRFFYNTGSIFAHKPLMPIPGNHDSQDGLGAQMYRDMFSLPLNGPKSIPTELSYSYVYQNTLFVMLDATQSVPDQSAWLEEQLKNKEVQWKFVMMHFPPYNIEEEYTEIIKEWGSLFDKYHVDMVMTGHMHYYMRTKPMFANKVVDAPSKGTIYLMSISIEGKQEEWPDEPYSVIRYKGGPLYQHMTIKDNKLIYKCFDDQGVLKDELVIQK